jgi:hypothetical protein
MFCPKCGLQQVSEAARFCPRCGLPLTAVAEMVANDGQWPAYLAVPGQGVSPRKRGLRQGAALMLAGPFLAALFGVMNAVVGTKEELALVGLLCFLLGLLRIIYAFFEEKAPTGYAAVAPPAYAPPQLDPRQHAAALPPTSAPPARGFFAGRRDTAQVAPPQSVTDGTTRLLDTDSDSPRGR